MQNPDKIFRKNNSVESILKFGNIESPNPKYSILIPTFDRELYLFEALDSIVNQQSNCLFEVIIVDNCPDPNISYTNKLTKYDPNIVFYYKNSSNIGMIENWNRAALLARGEWVSFLHDDDMFLPNYLNVMDFIISNNPNIKLLAPSVYFGEKLVLDHFEPCEILGHKISANILFFRNIIPTQGTMISKKCFEEINGFDSSLYPISDYSLWIDFVKYNLGIKINKKIVFYRVEDNESQKIETKLKIITSEYEQRIKYLKDSPNLIFKFFYIVFAKINYKLRIMEIIINTGIDLNTIKSILDNSSLKIPNLLSMFFLKFINRLYIFCLKIYISNLKKIKYIPG